MRPIIANIVFSGLSIPCTECSHAAYQSCRGPLLSKLFLLAFNLTCFPPSAQRGFLVWWPLTSNFYQEIFWYQWPRVGDAAVSFVLMRQLLLGSLRASRWGLVTRDHVMITSLVLSGQPSSSGKRWGARDWVNDQSCLCNEASIKTPLV